MALHLPLVLFGFYCVSSPGQFFERAGYICGVGWSAEGSEGYAPIRHPDSDCFDPDQVKRWLQDHVKAETAPYKYPRVVDFADALPKTASGKIKRAVLREGAG